MMRRHTLILTAIAISVIIVCACSAMAQDDNSDKRITIQLSDVPIQNALEMLFNETGHNYSLEQGVMGTVTVSLRNVPFELALETILKSADLTYRKNGGVYMVGQRKEIPEATMPTFEAPTVTEAPAADRKMLEKIPVGYVDAVDIASILSGQSSGTRFSNLGGYGGSGGYGSGTGGYGGGIGGYGSGTGGFGNFGGGIGGYGSGTGSYGSGFGNYGSGGYGGNTGGFGNTWNRSGINNQRW